LDLKKLFSEEQIIGFLEEADRPLAQRTPQIGSKLIRDVRP
jgi:hypothetical protein